MSFACDAARHWLDQREKSEAARPGTGLSAPAELGASVKRADARMTSEVALIGLFKWLRVGQKRARRVRDSTKAARWAAAGTEAIRGPGVREREPVQSGHGGAQVGRGQQVALRAAVGG